MKLPGELQLLLPNRRRERGEVEEFWIFGLFDEGHQVERGVTSPKLRVPFQAVGSLNFQESIQAAIS